MKVGRPPREFEDYHPLEVIALLTNMDDAKAEMTRASAPPPWWDREPEEPATTGAPRRRVKGPPTPGKRWRYDEPRYTGDPVIDAWEAAIARGETPDLETT